MLLSLNIGFSCLELQWLVQSLIELAVLSLHLNNCSKVLEACKYSKLLPFTLNLPLDTRGTLCHKFGLFSTFLHLYLVQVLWRRGLLVPALLQQEHKCHRPTLIGDSSVVCGNLSIMCFQGIRHNLFEEKYVEKIGETSLTNSKCCSGPFSCASIYLNFTYSLVVNVLIAAN